MVGNDQFREITDMRGDALEAERTSRGTLVHSLGSRYDTQARANMYHYM